MLTFFMLSNISSLVAIYINSWNNKNWLPLEAKMEEEGWKGLLFIELNVEV